MKIPAPHRILAVAGLCAATLVALVITESFAREGGQEITLPMEAVDPRALLTGHYVQLNFTNRLEQNEVCPTNSAGEWVALRPQGNIYVAGGAADSRDAAERLGPLPVKGTFTCSAPTPAQPDLAAMPGWLTLDLGVDRFHINQADAMRIERVLREQRAGEEARAFAVLSVGNDGRARLRALVIDNERFDLLWL